MAVVDEGLYVNAHTGLSGQNHDLRVMQAFLCLTGGLAITNFSSLIILTQQPAQNIQLMYHGVLYCRRIVPIADNICVAVCTVQQQRFAILAGFNCFLQLLVACVITAHETNLYQRLACFHFCCDDTLAGICLRCQRLLAKYILASLDGCGDKLLMICIGCGIDNCINLRIVNHGNRILIPLDAELFRNRQTKCCCRICTGNNLCALQLGVDALNVSTADATGSYQANSQFTHLKTSIFYHLCALSIISALTDTDKTENDLVAYIIRIISFSVSKRHKLTDE